MRFVALRLAAWFVPANANGGMWVPFFPAWLASRGLEPTQIGVIFGVMQLMRVIAGPAAGIAADARGDRRMLILWLNAGAVLAYVGIGFSSEFWPLLVFVVLSSMTYSPTGALMESLTLRQAATHGLDYGRIRAWGSAAFVVANVVSGFLVERFGMDVVMPFLVACVSASTVAAFFLPREPGHPRTVSFQDRLVQTLTEAGVLMRRRVFVVFLVASGLAQASHAVYYAFGAIHFQELGLSGPMIGVLWSLGVVVEVALLIFSRPLVDRFGPIVLLAAGAAFSMLRWTLLALDPPLPVIVFAQTLHGLTFGCAHVGAMYFLSRAVPPQLAATGQSVYSTLAYGPMMAAATLGAGPLFQGWGGLAYLAMTGLAGISLGAALVLRAAWSGGVLGAEAPAAPPLRYAPPIATLAVEQAHESLRDSELRP